jgi:hypothetical protein
LGDVEKMKECFAAMLTIEIPGITDEDGDLIDEESMQNDKLKEDIKEKKRVF